MFVAVIKTGLNVILACNMANNSPMIETMKLIGVTCISTIQQIAMDGIFDDKDVVLQEDTALSKGRRLGTGTLLSLYLALADLTTLAPAKHWFSASQQEYCWPRFMSFTYLNLLSTGYLGKDVCLVEVTVLWNFWCTVTSLLGPQFLCLKT
ncbi:hypothetical protein Pint_06818 [Pistacia integerrima]|uniref:Uncharacterized protein n=1 Tax=Pistacia integerrima TaxID=434235 RepID=A0ACC0XW36_9ROSI|nr:hypothetical protein Pint_06818 [Pistacia integerrima]